MNGPAICSAVGTRRIIRSQSWALEDLHPAELIIDCDEFGSLKSDILEASLRVGYARSFAFFTWEGDADGHALWGDGSAQVQENGELEIELNRHDGDQWTFFAVKTGFSTAC
jgi:hypothetical protein